MSWNYRVCRYVEQGETLFAIREVYYESDGAIKGFCSASTEAWEKKDLKGTVALMAQAFDLPVLNEASLLKKPRRKVRHGDVGKLARRALR